MRAGFAQAVCTATQKVARRLIRALHAQWARSKMWRAKMLWQNATFAKWASLKTALEPQHAMTVPLTHTRRQPVKITSPTATPVHQTLLPPLGLPIIPNAGLTLDTWAKAVPLLRAPRVSLRTRPTALTPAKTVPSTHSRHPRLNSVFLTAVLAQTTRGAFELLGQHWLQILW